MQTLEEDFKKAHDIKDVLSCFDKSGQKIVFIVTDNSGQKLAMKKFRQGTQRDRQEIELLKRFEAVGGIPKIVKIEEHEGFPLVFEEYIDAPDLEDIISTYKNSGEEIAELIKKIGVILKPIWEERIVHRDLKPKNIKILENGDPVILDFGIARDLSAESITETGDGQPMTWDYASPEQYRKDKDSISYRTDFFVLGIIAYVLYYQRNPFGSSRDEIERKFLAKDNAITLDDDCLLNPFLTANLVIDPSGRPRNVDAFLSTLEKT